MNKNKQEDITQDKNKKLWQHLNKELAKTKTLIEIAQKIIKSSLYTRVRYRIFTLSILDAYTRTILLSVYHLFDKKYSWSLYGLSNLTVTEKERIRDFSISAKDYIIVRQNEIGHISKKVGLEFFNRIEWLPANELARIYFFVKDIARFLNSYGMRNFNEGYLHSYDEIGIALQLLIEDLENQSYTTRGGK